MAGIITYPWARPHGYNLKLKKKKAASYKPQAASAHKEIGFKNFKYYLKKRLETDTIKK